jgi:hypothetical protein
MSLTTSAPSPQIQRLPTATAFHRLGAKSNGGRRLFGSAWRSGSATPSRPMLTERLEHESMLAAVTAGADTVHIEYEQQAEGSGYVRPVVLLELGARSTGEPFEQRTVTCDAASHLPDVTLPEAAPAVMRPERTFWEKATAIHVFLPRRPFSRSRTFLSSLVRHRVARQNAPRKIRRRRP